MNDKRKNRLLAEMALRGRGLYFAPDKEGGEDQGDERDEQREDERGQQHKDERSSGEREQKGTREDEEQRDQKRKPQPGEPGHYNEEQLATAIRFYSKPDQHESRRRLMAALEAAEGTEPRARKLERQLSVRDALDDFGLTRADGVFLTATEEDDIRAQAKALKARLDKATTTKKNPSDDDIDEGNNEDEEDMDDEDESSIIRDRSRKAPSPKDAVKRELAQMQRTARRGR